MGGTDRVRHIRPMRRSLLRWAYRIFPFDLRGDCTVPPASGEVVISCIINFYGRPDLLQALLFSLQEQEYPRDRFEVLLVEDRAGTDEGRYLAERFSGRMQIRYLPLDANFGRMGYSRNFGLRQSRGEIVLFLDDDTVILQKNFLPLLEATFRHNDSVSAVVPHGHAAWACLDRYDFHTPYFMTSRCTAYRRQTLQELGGFIDHFVGQEDVEFVTRFTIAGKTALHSPGLHYHHPPLLVPTMRKPQAVGFSFFNLRTRYSHPIWLLLLLNCARHAPLVLLPIRRFREQGRFGVGFMLGVLDGIIGRKGQLYG